MKEKSWKDKARNLISNHYLFFMIVGILIISILVPLIILICKNANVFGCDFEGWMCFFGGYAGGITAMISVLITIKHGDKEREKEKVESFRVYLDIMSYENASVEILEDYEPDVFKTLYLLDGEKGPGKDETFKILQVVNRSSYQVNQLKVIISSRESNGKEHTRFVNIPYVHPTERDYIVLPKPFFMPEPENGPGVLLSKKRKPPVEDIDKIRITYTTLGNERIELTVDDDLTRYNYKLSGSETYQFQCKSIGKTILPKIIKHKDEERNKEKGGTVR